MGSRWKMRWNLQDLKIMLKFYLYFTVYITWLIWYGHDYHGNWENAHYYYFYYFLGKNFIILWKKILKILHLFRINRYVIENVSHNFWSSHFQNLLFPSQCYLYLGSDNRCQPLSELCAPVPASLSILSSSPYLVS